MIRQRRYLRSVTNPPLNFFSCTPKRLSPNNPVISGDGTYENLCPAGIIEYPADTSKVIFYCGEFTGATTIGARVVYYLVSKSAPTVMGSRQGVVLAGSESYDIQGCRFGKAFKVGSQIWYYYVGLDATYKWRICRATSTDGVTFTKQGVCLDFNDVDEKSVSDPDIVIDDDGTWWMMYSGWDGSTPPLPNNNPGQSKVGIKLAYSSDGITWTKTNEVIVPLGASGSLDYGNVEGGTFYKVPGGGYGILYNGNNGASVWYVCLAFSDNVEGPYTKRPTPYFDKATGTGVWDNGLVATGYLYQFPSGWYFFYQALGFGTPDEIYVGGATVRMNPI
jgi:hypothetical protein